MSQKYTVVSTKFVPQKCESVRDNAVWHYGYLRVWICLIEGQGDSATRNEKGRIHVCAVSFHHAETPRGSIKQPVLKTTISHNNFWHLTTTIYLPHKLTYMLINYSNR